jgi:hypothetical protein
MSKYDTQVYQKFSHDVTPLIYIPEVPGWNPFQDADYAE